MTRRITSMVLASAMAITLLVQSPLARGQDPRATAAEFFRVGKESFQHGDFRAAALAFEEADRRAPHAITVYNAGLAWDGAGDGPRAADTYKEALDRGGLSGAFDAHAKERLEDIEKKLGLVGVKAPPGAVVSAAHAIRRPAPVVVHVVPGTIEVLAELPRSESKGASEPGREVRRKRIDVRAGERVEVVFEDTKTSPVSPSGSGSAVWAWIAVGGAVGAAGIGSVLGVRGLSARDDFEASGRTDSSARDAAIALRTGANVAFGIAIVVGVVGVIALLAGGPKSPAAAAIPTGVRF